MYPGEQVTALLEQMNISHVVWLPDSELGTWEEALLRAPFLKLIRVCREGEAWAIAAGLKMGGQNPLVIIQCTGEAPSFCNHWISQLSGPGQTSRGHRTEVYRTCP